MGTEKITLSNKHLSCGRKGKDRGKIMLYLVESTHKGPEARYLILLAELKIRTLWQKGEGVSGQLHQRRVGLG